MTTQADSVDPCRRRPGELGKSLEPGDRRRAQVDVLMPVPTTERMVRRARPSETCESCGNRAFFVLMMGPDEPNIPTCSTMTELRAQIRHGLEACSHRNDLTKLAGRGRER